MSRIDWNDGSVVRLLWEAINVGITESANVAADEAARSMGRDHGGVPSSPNGPPNSQSGRLRNSIVYVSPQSLGTPGKAAIGSAVEYARIIELGGTVFPKSVKYLPVPVNKAAKKMLNSTADRGIGGVGPQASLRRFRLKLKFGKDKKLLLVEQTATGKEKKNGAVFVLKKSVKIAARPYLMPQTQNPQTAKEMEDRFVQAARQVLRRAV